MNQVISNGEESRERIIKELLNASRKINLAMAYFTDVEIANTIHESIKRGVEVEVVLAKNDLNDKVIQLLGEDIILHVHDLNSVGTMHHKFCIVDDRILLHGSYNYTYNATKNNQEVLIVTDDLKLIGEFKLIFQKLLEDIEVNPAIQNPNKPTLKPMEDIHYLDDFNNQLKGHISQMFDDFDKIKITDEGRNLSEDSGGQMDVFRSYLDSVIDEVHSRLNKDDQTKTLIKTRMQATLERALESNSKNKESELSVQESYFDNELRNIELEENIAREKLNEKQQEIQDKTTEQLLLKAEIEGLKEEVDTLDRQIVVKRFWKFPTYFKMTVSAILIMLLSFFFASAFYKLIFESKEYNEAMLQGITPDSPMIFDGDAIQKINDGYGIGYAIFAALFFVIPLLVTNVNLFSRKSKVLEIFMGYIIGIFLFDVVASILINQHTLEIKNMVNGTEESWSIWNALSQGEFWLIFIFGALPLFILKLLIENLWEAYEMSNPENVDRERFLLKNSLKARIINKDAELLTIQNQNDNLKAQLDHIKNNLTSLEDKRIKNSLNRGGKNNELNERFENKIRNLREIYNSFVSSVDSGSRQFMENVVSGRITAFKTGFFLHLTSYYASKIANQKIEELENEYKIWSKQKFGN